MRIYKVTFGLRFHWKISKRFEATCVEDAIAKARLDFPQQVQHTFLDSGEVLEVVAIR